MAFLMSTHVTHTASWNCLLLRRLNEGGYSFLEGCLFQGPHSSQPAACGHAAESNKGQRYHILSLKGNWWGSISPPFVSSFLLKVQATWINCFGLIPTCKIGTFWSIRLVFPRNIRANVPFYFSIADTRTISNPCSVNVRPNKYIYIIWRVRSNWGFGLSIQ